MSESIKSISNGLDILVKNPVLLAPFAAPIVVQWVFSTTPNPLILMLGLFISAILGFIAACMLIDMANDVLNGRPAYLSKSLNVVINRIGTLIVVAIIAALLGATVILLPMAIFIVVVVIIEQVGVVESLKGAFSFVLSNAGKVVVFILLVIVIGTTVSYSFSIIPIIGPYTGAVANWLLNAFFTVSATCLYTSLKASPAPVAK